jgi:hypothetical protein
MSRKEIAAFCEKSFRAAVLTRPLDYARKVFTQLGYFIFPDEGTFFRTRIKMGKLYEYFLTTVPESLDLTLSPAVREMFAVYRQSAVAQVAPSTSLEVYRPFRSFLRVVRSAAFWIGAAFSVSLAACLAASSLTPFRLPGVVATIFFLAPAANALTIALIHALDNSRYRGSYGPLVLFALAAMLVFIITILAQATTLWFHRNTRDQPSPID